MTGTTSGLAKNFPANSSGAPILIDRMPANPDGSPGAPAVLEERRGRELWIRSRRDDEPESETQFVAQPGEIVVPFSPLPWMSLNTSPTIGENRGFMFGIPLVETGRDDYRKVLFARTRRVGESDSLPSPRLPYGYQIELPAGAVVVELQWIERQVPEDEDGYRPLTDALWSWLSIGDNNGDPNRLHYLLAAARRLDSSHRALVRASAELSDLDEKTPGPRLRGAVFRFFADVESCVISFSRALQMTSTDLGFMGPVKTSMPSELVLLSSKLKLFRDAYEHIDERARGLVKGRPDPTAMTIFDWSPALQGTLTYANGTVSLSEVERAMDLLRSYLLQVSAEVVEVIA